MNRAKKEILRDALLLSGLRHIIIGDARRSTLLSRGNEPPSFASYSRHKYFDEPKMVSAALYRFLLDHFIRPGVQN
jgi:hypothetical protein